jgi:hypothetical protein
MKKLGIMMTAAILFLGASAFANDITAKQVKPEVKKEAPQAKTHKAHKTHKQHHKAKATAPKADAAPKA